MHDLHRWPAVPFYGFLFHCVASRSTLNVALAAVSPAIELLQCRFHRDPYRPLCLRPPKRGKSRGAASFLRKFRSNGRTFPVSATVHGERCWRALRERKSFLIRVLKLSKYELTRFLNAFHLILYLRLNRPAIMEVVRKALPRIEGLLCIKTTDAAKVKEKRAKS